MTCIRSGPEKIVCDIMPFAQPLGNESAAMISCGK